MPKHFEDVPAIGPGGEYTGETYGAYIKEAQKFVWAIFDVFKEGDSSGKPFVFPRPKVHITKKFFQTPGHKDFLLHICDVAGEKGNTYFVFDQEDTISMSECGSLNLKEEKEELENTGTPWKMRYAAIQNVTINLPRLGYKSNGNDEALFSQLSEVMELAAKAHLQKKDFIEKLLSHGDEGPLSLLTMNCDGIPYLRMARASYLVGMVGLNELVRIQKGSPLHENKDARKFGLKVITRMKDIAVQLTKKYGMRFVLVQTPAESTAYRFARLDLKHFSPEAGHFVRGDISNGEVYYTNSTLLDVSSPTTPINRVKFEGLFHPLIEGGAVTHVWLGETKPSKESLSDFVIKVFKDSENLRLTFSPEFTTCLNCGKTSRGLHDRCIYCQSEDVEGISKITGYFSKISNWNKGKLAELRDRKREQSL